MKVRHAKDGDIFDVLAMLRRHHEGEGFDWPFDAARLSMGLQQAIFDPEKCVLVCDGGMLWGACVQSPVAPFKIACEIVIRAEKPGARDALIDAFEEWAIFRDCSSARLYSIKKHRAFGRLWGRHGYTVDEVAHSKPLQGG